MLEDKDEEKDKIKELSEKAKENLKRNEELRQKSSKFQSVQPSEKFLWLFDPEKIQPVEQEFDGKKIQRFQYTIKDPNIGQEKYWIVSKRTSEQIDAFLMEGRNLLKIQRLGSGNDTRYNIFPA